MVNLNLPLTIASIIAFALGALLGIQSFRLHNSQQQLASERLQFAEAQRDATIMALKWNQHERQVEANWRARTEVLREEFNRASRRDASIISGLRGEHARMLNAIRNYAAGASEARNNSIPSCESRAISLGDALAGALRTEEELTAELEYLNSVARVLHEQLLQLTQRTDESAP